jgi:uncharacterized protein
MKKLLIFVLLVLLLMLLFFRLKNPFSEKETQIKIKDTVFTVELADTQEKRVKGLSGRESLSSGHGMLFVFNKAGYHSFWMKDMNFPLDFIWIRENKIVEITKDVLPIDYKPPNILSSKEKADMVLEINAGETNIYNLRIGDKFSFKD